MLKIGTFSKLSRISVRMLRYYDDQGLLQPESTDPDSGYRYYSESQLVTANRISAFRDMGFGLAEIRQLLLCDDKDLLDDHLLHQRRAITAQMAQLHQQLALLDSARNQLRKESNMEYNVTVKSLPERYAACCRMTIPTYEQEGMLWSNLVSETIPLGVKTGEDCIMAVTYHDGEYKETDVDCEAWKTVIGRYEDTDHVKFRTLPEVTFASAIHHGSYTGIGDAIAAVAAWIEANGYEYDGPAFNIYHVSPAETQDPAQFLTEVCYPVRKK